MADGLMLACFCAGTLGALAAAGAVVLLRRSITVVTVVGHSMSPTYADGDRVVIRRIPAARVRPGQVVVIGKPHSGNRAAASAVCPRRAGSDLMIKRVIAVPGDPRPHVCPPQAAETIVPPGQFVVLGDNPVVSHDSRQLGYFSADHLLGIVLRRLTPRTANVRDAAVVTEAL